MYEVSVSNYVNTVNKSWKVLEWGYACDIFVTAAECEDCEHALLVDAVTGELYAEYKDDTVTIHNLPEEDKLTK